MIESKKIIKQRSCMGCRAVRHKSELIRCVKSPTGEVAVDLDGKAQGRGAYVCKNLECLAKVKKKRLFNKAFKTAVDDSIYVDIEEIISHLCSLN